jgi:hypothetical protein
MNFKALLKWLGARAKEKSTWIGAATIAATFVPQLTPVLQGVGQVVGLVFGGAMVAATTTPAAPAEASVIGTGVTS